MTKYKWMHKLALVAVIALSACVKAQKKDINAENESGGPRSFRLSKSGDLVDVTGYKKNLLVSNDIDVVRKADVDVAGEHARYSNRREYNLKMCGLADVRGNGSILGQKFRVYSELEIRNNDLTVQTDGCLYWQVSLPFNYFGDSVNLEINFIFKSEKGMAYIHKTMLFNPWDSRRGDNPETFDYTRFGLSDRMLAMPWARGIDEVDLALSGKLLKTIKKLEIGSVTVVPVQKNKQNFIETTLIGTEVSQNLDSKYTNEDLRTKLNGGNKVQSLDLHLNVRLDNLKIRLFDTAGVNKDESLTTGRYKIYAQLVATDQATRGHYIITDKLNVSNTKEWTTSTMGVNAVLPISLVIRPQWGNLNLLLKVVPVDIPGVQPFEGLYQLGRFDEIKGGKSPLFDLSEYTISKESEHGFTFNYDDYLKRSANFKEWEKGIAEQGIDDVSTLEKGFRRFLYSQLDVLFSRIMPGDTSTDRTIQYTVETCLTDNFTGARPGAGLKFEIETEDRGVTYKTLRQTNDLGCLTWVGMISHKFYHRENLVKKYSKLTYLGEDSDKPSFTLDYYINPWDEKFTFGRDARRLTPEYLDQIKKTQENAPPTRVLITDFKYDATGFRYAIDRYMNMTVKKTVLMTINPVILKYNSIVWGRSGLSDLRDGIYLLKIAMQKDYLDPMANKGVVVTSDMYPSKRVGGNLQTMTQEESENLEKKQFLVVKETLVRVLGGKIVTPIEFEINDLRTLRIRSQMLIQIETIDEMLLRAALIANGKLNSLLKDTKSETTVEIMGLQSSLQDLENEMKRLQAQKDYQIMAEYIQLVNRSKELKDQMTAILGDINKEAAERILAQLDEIRKLGETGVSADRNAKFDALNNAIISMKRKIQKAAVQQEKETERAAIQVKLNECKVLMSNLINQGHVEEAKLYDPEQADKEGSLCKTKITKEELFYYLTSSDKAGSDAWFQALLTPDEFALYQSNLLRDDFTKPYPPDFDFSLLSNQGDERYDDNEKPRAQEIDQEISGLPRRTFIGPVTFVLNGNGSAMRPTDVLDENSCNNTCEALSPVEKQVMDNNVALQDERKQFGDSVNSLYENSPYYGSIEHFYKKQVNDLQVVDRGLKYQYHQEMKAFSQIGNFLDQTLLKYVSFAEKPQAINRLDFNCYAKWKSQMEESYRKWRTREDLSFAVSKIPESCFVSANDRVLSLNKFKKLRENEKRFANTLVDRKILEYGSLEVPDSDMKEFSKNGLMSKTLDFDQKVSILHKMCHLMRLQLHPQTEEFKNSMGERAKGTLLGNLLGSRAYYSQYREKTDNIENECHTLVETFTSDVQEVVKRTNDVNVINAVIAMKSKQLPLVVERRVRVLETSNRYLYKDGKTLNYSVGTGFSTSHSLNTNRGYKLDPLEVIEKLGGTIGGLGKGLINKAGGVANGVLGSVSGMVNFQWGVGESLSVSDGTSVGENTTLAAQISTLDIELSKWEKCVVVRFDESFFANAMSTHYGSAPFFRPSEDIQGLGYFMCSGDVDTKDDLIQKSEPQKLRVRERYFYLTQIFNEGDMQDPGALANHPWMLQLRGMRDFGRFEKILKAPTKDVNWFSAVEYMSKDLWTAVTLGADTRHGDRPSMEVINRDDVAKALDLMSNSFDRVMPTFPGMYTFSDTPYDNVVGWPEK